MAEMVSLESELSNIYYDSLEMLFSTQGCPSFSLYYSDPVIAWNALPCSRLFWHCIVDMATEDVTLVTIHLVAMGVTSH